MEKMKVFIACAIGAGIGTLVALSVSQYFWWIGLIVGCLFGYFSYEFKAVISAVRIAWKNVIGWRPDKKIVKHVFNILISMLGCYTTIWLVVFLLPFGFEEYPKFLSSDTLISVSLASAILFMFLIMFHCDSSDQSKAQEEIIILGKNMIPVYFHFYVLFVFFPVSVWLCVKNIAIFFWKMPRRTKKITVILLKFTKTVFILIHSEARLICGVDAGIGVFVGYFTGHIIIGALAGGLFGLLNYEIVSKRVLKLVPKRT
jgi:hypothetical protein